MPSSSVSTYDLKHEIELVLLYGEERKNARMQECKNARMQEYARMQESISISKERSRT